MESMNADCAEYHEAVFVDPGLRRDDFPSG
jgi:hypothetical protein